MTLTWLGGVALVVVVGAAWELMRGNRRVERLRNVPADAGAPPLRVSIVIAARDEARKIPRAQQ